MNSTTSTLKTFLSKAFFFPTSVKDLGEPNIVMPKAILSVVLGIVTWWVMPANGTKASEWWLIPISIAGFGSFALGIAAVQISVDRRALVPGTLSNWFNAQCTRLLFWKRTECPNCGRRVPYGRGIPGPHGLPRYICRICFSEWDELPDGRKRMVTLSNTDEHDSERLSEPLFQRVAAFLEAREYNYDSDAETRSFALSFGITNGSVHTVVQVLERGTWQRLSVSGKLSVKVPEGRRAEVADAINRINDRLAVGNLEMSPADGSLRVRTYLEGDTGISESMMEYALHMNVEHADRFFTPLMAVAFGGMTPEAAVSIGESHPDSSLMH